MSPEEWLRQRGIEPQSKRGPQAGQALVSHAATRALPTGAPLSAWPPPPSEAIDAAAASAADDADAIAAGATLPIAAVTPVAPAATTDDAPDASTVRLPVASPDVSRQPTRRLPA